MCATATIEHHSLRAFQEGDLSYFGRKDIIGIARNTVDENQDIALIPQLAIVTTHKSLHIREAIGGIVLFHQFFNIHSRHAAKKILILYRAERHVDFGGVEKFVGLNITHRQQPQDSYS